MTIRQASDKNIRPCFILSTVIHLAVFLLMSWWGVLFPPDMTIRETYYVDVVNLPVASPRSGSPTQKGDDAEAPAPPAPENRMIMPEASSKPDKGKTGKTPKVDETDPLQKALAKVKSKAEAQQADAAIERLRRNSAARGSGRAGMPGAFGTEAGSRYEDYIKSRLEDALKKTISYSTRKPEVYVRLVIAADGRISRQKIERSSGDPLFNRAVLRAIEIAGENFRPTPNRRAFEGGFIFKPQGISNRK